MENILKFFKKSPVMAIILGYILLIVVQHFFDILHFIPILLQHITTAEGALHSLGFLVTFGALMMSYKSFKTASLRAAAETIAQAENYVQNNAEYLRENHIKYGAHLDLTGALELLHKNGRNFTYLHLPHAFLLEANLQGADLTNVEGLTREQILSAKWVRSLLYDSPPILPDYITHPDGVEDKEIAHWLATPSKE